MLRAKHQITLPDPVIRAAGIHVNDLVEWRFESGEIRGVKLEPARRPKAVLVKKAGYTMLRSGRRIATAEMLDAIRREGL